ncbi:MAG: hypothetical protein AAF152_00335 [Cyanobacteria bacterium P01_A01_bin.114]
MARHAFEQSMQLLEPDTLQLGDRGWDVEQLQIQRLRQSLCSGQRLKLTCDRG